MPDAAGGSASCWLCDAKLAHKSHKKKKEVIGGRGGEYRPATAICRFAALIMRLPRKAPTQQQSREIRPQITSRPSTNELQRLRSASSARGGWQVLGGAASSSSSSRASFKPPPPIPLPPPPWKKQSFSQVCKIRTAPQRLSSTATSRKSCPSQGNFAHVFLHDQAGVGCTMTPVPWYFASEYERFWHHRVP